MQKRAVHRVAGRKHQNPHFAMQHNTGKTKNLSPFSRDIHCFQTGSITRGGNLSSAVKPQPMPHYSALLLLRAVAPYEPETCFVIDSRGVLSPFCFCMSASAGRLCGGWELCCIWSTACQYTLNSSYNCALPQLEAEASSAAIIALLRGTMSLHGCYHAARHHSR